MEFVFVVGGPAWCRIVHYRVLARLDILLPDSSMIESIPRHYRLIFADPNLPSLHPPVLLE